jgi:hypothetical protein
MWARGGRAVIVLIIYPLTGSNARQQCGDVMVTCAGDADAEVLMRSTTRSEAMTTHSPT